MSELEKLKEKNEELEKALEKEKKDHEKTKKEFQQTKKEFEQYKTQYPATKELPSFVKEDIKHIKKTPGQKLGHKGYFRKIPERIDFIKSLAIDFCPHCNNQLSETQEIRERIVIDIPLTYQTINTQYKIHRKYCKTCNQIVEPEVPNALANSPFGLNLMLYVTFLKINMALPYNKIRQLLIVTYNLEISEGGLVNILSQIKDEFGDYYQTLENKIRKGRGSEVPIKVLGKQKNKVIICDGFSAYNKLKTLTKCLIQLCWFHILKNSRNHQKNYPEEATIVHDKLKKIYALAKSYNHKATDEQVEQLKKEIRWLAYPIYKHHEVKGFIKTLNDRIEDLFRFTQDEEIEGDNNLAERGLRKAVIIRKISNGNRSAKGAEILEVLLSIVETARLQKKNPLNFMHKILASES